MGKEKERDERINNILDRADVADGVIVDRITETLAIDGETHPSRKKVAREVRKLHGRKSKRRTPAAR